MTESNVRKRPHKHPIYDFKDKTECAKNLSWETWRILHSALLGIMEEKELEALANKIILIRDKHYKLHEDIRDLNEEARKYMSTCLRLETDFWDKINEVQDFLKLGEDKEE